MNEADHILKEQRRLLRLLRKEHPNKTQPIVLTDGTLATYDQGWHRSRRYDLYVITSDREEGDDRADNLHPGMLDVTATRALWQKDSPGN
ncbi:MAG: hypothetical protein OXL37_03575 [Chloroflexota bacterium]|nr:hypothetical protein [Chloroflexota bacterium]MDE2958603.1 hypothetical protein [Chloroflexota bacterium]